MKLNGTSIYVNASIHIVQNERNCALNTFYNCSKRCITNIVKIENLAIQFLFIFLAKSAKQENEQSYSNNKLIKN